MKLDSKYFDGIRIKNRHPEPEPQGRDTGLRMGGCDQPGLYKAPKSNRAVGEYHHFCLEHVRHYNQVFNFFEGMKPEEMEAHPDTPSARPTAAPAGALAPSPVPAGPRMPARQTADHDRRAPHQRSRFGVFARYARHQNKQPAQERVKPLHEPRPPRLRDAGLSPATSRPRKSASPTRRWSSSTTPTPTAATRTPKTASRAVIAAYAHLKAKGFVGR